MSTEDSARNLEAEIRQNLKDAQYAKALAGIDSFSKTFPLQVDIRRSLLKSRAEAVQGLAMQRLPRLIDSIAQLEVQVDKLEAEMVTVQPSKNLNGYLVYCEARTLASPGIQGRVNTGDDIDYIPWTLAVDAGRDIALDKVTVTTAAGAVYDIPLPVSEGTVASGSPEAAAPLARAIATGDPAVSAVMSGAKGTVKAKVSPATSRGIALAYELAQTRFALRQCRIEAEKTDRTLTLARDQEANAR